MLKKVALALAALLVVFLGYVSTRPDTFTVERFIEVQAAPAAVMAQLDDFRAWGAWSPWERLDPNMNKTFEGPERGVGSSYTWKGNSDVGSGKMTIVEQTPLHIRFALEFFEPMASKSDTNFFLAPSGDALTRVTWKMSGDCNFLSKLFGVFVDMDALIGKDFESGLAQLKAAAEAK